MEANATKIHGDFNICPVIEISPTTGEPILTSSTNLTPPTTDNIKAINILPILRGSQPEVLPLFFNPQEHEVTSKNPIEIGNKTKIIEQISKKNETNLINSSTITVNNNNNNNEVNEKVIKTTPSPVEGNVINSVILNSPVIFKKENGQNLSLVVPVDNGIVKNDQVVENYMGKSENKDIKDKDIIKNPINKIEIM